MALAKKERRITITIGLIIGITISSMIVRHALDVKSNQAAQRPGNYNSQHSASGNISFSALPDAVTDAIPHGIVVYFEGNRSSVTGMTKELVDCWVIETAGSFRSERLFILAEADKSSQAKIKFSRASEIYVQTKNGYSDQQLEGHLDREKFKIIGRNSRSNEQIVQIRNFSPTELIKADKFLNSLEVVKSTRFSPWSPAR